MFFKLLKESFLFAVNSVVVNRLRTFLSLFGISIGIFSIISVFTVLDWMAKSVRDSISTLGDNVIYVQKYPWDNNPNLAWWDLIKRPAVSLNDYEALQKRSNKADAICFIAAQNANLKYKNNNVDLTVVAATQELQSVRAFELSKGRYFSPFESSSGKNVVLLGGGLAEKLFPDIDPIGKSMTVSGNKATVIGVLKKEGKGGISLFDFDDLAIIPLNFGKGFINLRNPFLNSQLAVKARPGILAEELSEETIMVLRAARRLHPDEENNFSVNKASILAQTFDAVFAGINIGGWVIGGFAILVGGFGIANIMFVSVRERTNIIGIQKALGAKRSFILQEFLIESVLLSIAGGLIGLSLIFVGTLGINYFYEIGMHLTAGNIILAVFISGIIGVIAGYAPAYSAAKMDPVEAMGFSF